MHVAKHTPNISQYAAGGPAPTRFGMNFVHNSVICAGMKFDNPSGFATSLYTREATKSHRFVGFSDLL